MQPIVNGLIADYQAEVVFQQINAERGEGLALLQAYSLFGHPSYLILDEKGEVLWRSVGEVPEAEIRSVIHAILSN